MTKLDTRGDGPRPTAARLLLAAAFAVVAGLAPSPARAQGGLDTGGGCIALGNGPTVTPAQCQYVAPDDSQIVLGAVLGAGTDDVTPQPWQIYVVRCCSKTDPSDCSPVLGENGAPPDPLAYNCLQPRGEDGKPVNAPVTVMLHESEGIDVTTVHPIPGEVVTVFIGSARLGFVSAGLDESVLPGGLPAP